MMRSLRPQRVSSYRYTSSWLPTSSKMISRAVTSILKIERPDQLFRRREATHPARLEVLQRRADASQLSFLLRLEQFLIPRLGEHDVLRPVVADDVEVPLAMRSSTAAMPRRLISWAGMVFMV
jgi:hypothetical protein